MKILIIDEEFPYPLNSGKRIRSFQLAKALTQFHEVHYLGYGDAQSESFEALAKASLHPIAVDPPDRSQSGIRFYLRLAQNLFSKYPYIVTSHVTARYKHKLRSVQEAEQFDMVICEWSPYAIFLREIPHTKSIVVAHNIEASIWKRYRDNEKSLMKRAYISHQCGKVESFERSAFLWSSGATAVSKSEAETIAGYGVNYDVAVIDNGVELNYFVSGDAEVRPHHLVFSGSMDWRPNQDAALYFVNEILPLLHMKYPDITITLVGRRPPDKILALADNDAVHVTGTVDDVRPFIDCAAVYIVPLRIGGGSRLKILEAMAMGKPVVSTSVGAEGLDVVDQRHLLLADNPEQFANKTIELLDDQDKAAELGRAGRKLVESRYGWEQLGRKLHEYIEQVVQS